MKKVKIANIKGYTQNFTLGDGTVLRIPPFSSIEIGEESITNEFKDAEIGKFIRIIPAPVPVKPIESPKSIKKPTTKKEVE